MKKLTFSAIVLMTALLIFSCAAPEAQKPEEHTVTFTGDITRAPVVVKEGESFTLPEGMPEKEGFVLEVTMGSIVLRPGTGYTISEDTVLVCRWKQKLMLTIDGITQAVGSGYEYVFVKEKAGWILEGIKVNGKLTEEKSITVTEDTEVEYLWHQDIARTITFDIYVESGERFSLPPLSYPNCTDFTLPYMEGYWIGSLKCGEKDMIPGDTIRITEDITLDYVLREGSKELQYETIDGKASVLDTGDEYSGEITIPDRLEDGTPVCSIPSGLFEGCSDLTYVALSHHITSIPEGTFRNCTALTAVTVPDKLTEIGKEAFSGCTSLSDMILPDSVGIIGPSAFKDCTGFTAIKFPAGITTIYEGTFSGCTGISSITVPEGVKSIGEAAFAGCTALDSLILPEGLETIGTGMARECTSLMELRIPKSVTKIEGNPSGGWEGSKIILAPGIKNYGIEEGKYLIDSTNGRTLLAALHGGNDIPKRVQAIGPGAFSGRKDLPERFEIPNNVSYVAEHAFSYTAGMKEIVFPDRMTEIKPYTFFACEDLYDVTVPAHIKKIGDYAFADCPKLHVFKVDPDIEDIGCYVFKDSGTAESVIMTTGGSARNRRHWSGWKKSESWQTESTFAWNDGWNGKDFIIESGGDYESLENQKP